MQYRYKQEVALKLAEMEHLGYVTPKEQGVIEWALMNDKCNITLITSQSPNGSLKHIWQITLEKEFNIGQG